ncbi:ABC transporter ATP-binding protein [Flavobacterium jejuense]|uniref:ABC transporter ATP-binding protein n=1 Tax=Flavobacterium jejuense TaxID=1544455 RepID=A0ABX0IVE1_9FLAO|nr:ABC transporter ATP-binding protein [Flavobacterium jejuense]NHN27438.1 ABC transporter ATP-binding protein [Flavobacterium jejuense]
MYLNRKQAKIAFNLSSEYSLLLSKNYILGNYSNFVKEKKSSLIKEILFVANDFVSNLLLSLNTIFSEVLVLTAFILIGLIYYTQATAVTVILIGSIVITIKYYNKKTLNKINKIKSNDYDKNISNLNNLLNGYLSIKSESQIKFFLEKFKNSNQQLNSNYAILHAKRINISRQTEILVILIICIGYFYLITFPIKNTEIVSFLSLFAALFFKTIPSINKLNLGFTNFYSHLYSLNILEKKVASISKNNTTNKVLGFSESITLKDISFYYEPHTPILKELNLSLKKGSFTAIIGKSGKGKTTLLNIIAKLINANFGKIYLDNVEIDEKNKYDYFNMITYLTQKPFIYEGTIIENINLNNEISNTDLLDEIIIGLDLKDTIDNLPNGFNSFIGSEGNILSGGQLQRICIARALLNKTEILILDEATNSLDKHSEEIIIRFIYNFTKKHNITVVLISHFIKTTENLYSSIINLDNYEV